MFLVPSQKLHPSLLRLFLYVLQLGFLGTHWSRDNALRVNDIPPLPALTIGNQCQKSLLQLCDFQHASIRMGIALGNYNSILLSNLKVNKHFVIAEIFLILNFLVILRLYIRLGCKPSPINYSNCFRLFFLEAPVARLPLAVLLIEILHNGAVAFCVKGTEEGLLSNILIWIILVVGGGVVVWFRDWYIHLQSMLTKGYLDSQLRIMHFLLLLNKCRSRLTSCNGSSVFQLSIRLLIVAFVISGVVALLSIVVMILHFRQVVEDVAAETQAHVDSGVDETSRLLGGQS